MKNQKTLYIMLSLLILVAPGGVQAEEDSAELTPANLLYRQAHINLQTVDAAEEKYIKNDKGLEETIENGWEKSPYVIELIEKNKKAITFLKKAARQESNHEMFMKTVPQYSFVTETPNYFKEIRLFELLLAEGEKFYSERKINQAEENYALAMRVVLHLGQEKFQTLIAELIRLIFIEKGYDVIERSLNRTQHSLQYYQEMQKTLESILKNQDFLANAFTREEALLQTAPAYFMTEVASNIIGSDEMKDKGTIIRFVLFRTYFLNAFMQHLKRSYSHATEICFRTARIAMQENKPQVFEQWRKTAEERLNKNENDILRYAYWLFNRKKAAENLGYKFAVMAMPSFEKSTNRYHFVHNKLVILTVACAIKQYKISNKKFPQTLEALVPDFIDSIPVDTYNEFKSLSYIQKDNKAYIYSFGLDKENDRAEKMFSWKEFNEDNTIIDGDIVLILE